jgi:site-specific recombinase XerD
VRVVPLDPATGVQPLKVQRGHVEGYVRHLEDDGYAPNTICQRISTLSSFYRWAVTEQHLAANPVEGARRPRKPTESAANGLSRHELTDWLDAAERRGGHDNVQYLVKALCRDIGVDRRITPHSSRHSSITMALDAGIGLRDVQDFARHEDPKTTRRYDRSRNQLNRHATSRSPSASPAATESLRSPRRYCHSGNPVQLRG